MNGKKEITYIQKILRNPKNSKVDFMVRIRPYTPVNNAVNIRAGQ